MNYFNKQPVCRSFAILACTLFIMASPDGAPAQQRPAVAVGAPAGTLLRIRDLPKMGRSTMMRTPEYQSNVSRTARGTRRLEWAVLEVEYETAPEWIDEVSFTFYLMTHDRRNKNQYNYFETSATYVDVARGTHRACVVLLPAAVERYGEPSAFGVDIFVQGERVATQSVGSIEEWWKKISGQPNINTRSGYLVERSKTPFAWAFIEDYEVVK